MLNVFLHLHLKAVDSAKRVVATTPCDCRSLNGTLKEDLLRHRDCCKIHNICVQLSEGHVERWNGTHFRTAYLIRFLRRTANELHQKGLMLPSIASPVECLKKTSTVFIDLSPVCVPQVDRCKTDRDDMLQFWPTNTIILSEYVCEKNPDICVFLVKLGSDVIFHCSSSLPLAANSLFTKLVWLRPCAAMQFSSVYNCIRGVNFVIFFPYKTSQYL